MIMQFVDKLRRPYKQAISVAYDATFAMLIAYICVVFRVDTLYIDTSYQSAILIYPLVVIFVFHLGGVYQVIARYVSFRFLVQALKATLVATIIWFGVLWFLGFDYPRTSIIMSFVLLLGYLTLSRMAIRLVFKPKDIIKAKPESVIIFGAGAPGRQIMRLLESSATRKVVGFIDDKRDLRNTTIAGVMVYARKDIPELIETFNVKEIFLSIPPANEFRKKEIIHWLYQFPVRVYKLENVDSLIAEQIKLNDLKEIKIEDILGRDAVKAQEELLTACIKDKVVMITGAGGSIGSQLCREVIKHKPNILILFEISEFALYQIEAELRNDHFFENSNIQIIALLGDVKNKQHIDEILTKYNVQTIYHAAAYKHVPIVEYNIQQGIRNNTFGTQTIALSAGEHGVEHFILISTDKAVRPTNFMGASKRMAEMSVQALQDIFPMTSYVTVRFGNVLGSSGSVVPLFRKQIEQNGPVTVTHPDITRYFMTIPEAVSLVIQAGSMGKGGDLFLLDMGEPVKIVDLAKNMIMLSGRTPKDEHGFGDIDIQFIGLRPGEKLYEELLIDADAQETDHPRIKRAQEAYLSYELLQAALQQMDELLEAKAYQALSCLLEDMIAGFTHKDPIVDPFIQV